jgi:hypothetical protein
MEVLPINVYVTIQLVLVDLQALVYHVQALHQNALTAHVCAPIAMMLAELAAQHVQPANIVNSLMELINVYVTTQSIPVRLAL